MLTVESLSNSLSLTRMLSERREHKPTCNLTQARFFLFWLKRLTGNALLWFATNAARMNAELHNPNPFLTRQKKADLKKAGLHALARKFFLESSSILGRNDERLNHFGRIVIAVELVQLIQPEFVASIIGVLAAVRIAPEITHELHQHKRAVEFVSGQILILGDLS